jgi:hypothetical protein
MVSSRSHLEGFKFQVFQFQPKPSRIPDNYPQWASWKSRESYLPPEIHSSKSFKNNLALVRKDLTDSLKAKASNIDGPLLLFGLLYREVSRAIEAEPDGETAAPAHLINSPLGIKELNQIEKALNEVELKDS